MTARKAKASPAPMVDDPNIPNPTADAPIVVVDDHSPRYEAAAPAGGHTMVEDPDTHVIHCKHCHAPAHMADIPCEPREFT